MPAIRRVANSKAELDALLARCPDDTLVVDQRRNIGALAKSFPRLAKKTDERDAQIIARVALGMPQTLRPVPADDPALNGVRIISAQIAQMWKDRTACTNASYSRLPESCQAFKAACEMTETWCAGMLAELGDP